MRVSMLEFINGEIVAVTWNGSLRILNEDLEVEKEFNIGENNGGSPPTCLAGNETFLAFGNYAGVVRYYRRNGVKDPHVSM